MNKSTIFTLIKQQINEYKVDDYVILKNKIIVLDHALLVEWKARILFIVVQITIQFLLLFDITA